MSLFRKPGSTTSGLKFLVYGREGTGKTIFGLSFPNIALVDTENGATPYENTDFGKNLELVVNTQNYKDLDEAISYVKRNHEKEGIQTLMTDSVTKIRQTLSDAVLNVDIKRNRSNGMQDADLNSNLSMRSWGTIGTISKRQSNRKIDLSSSVNIVDIAQLKEITDDKGNVIRLAPDMDKSAPYEYDVKLRFYNQENSKGEMKIFAVVEKDRTLIFKTGDVIEAPHFDMWAEYYKKNQSFDKLETNYEKQNQQAYEAYNKSVEYDDLEPKEKVQAIAKDLNEENRKAFLEEIKETKLHTKLDKLTKKEQEVLQVVVDKYSALTEA